MNYEGGNMCNDTSKYSLSVQINCNSNLDKTTYALDKESLKSPCDPRVIMNSPHACPVLSSGPLQKFLDEYNYWIGIPMILIGGYLLGAGGRFPGGWMSRLGRQGEDPSISHRRLAFPTVE